MQTPLSAHGSTIIPVASAAVICRAHGRSPASVAILSALSQPIPDSWQLRQQAEDDDASGRDDLLLLDQIAELDEQHYEEVELTLAEELTQAPSYKVSAADETQLRAYALVPSASLRRQLAAYVAQRTSTFQARRAGGAVVSESAEHDTQCLLR